MIVSEEHTPLCIHKLYSSIRYPSRERTDFFPTTWLVLRIRHTVRLSLTRRTTLTFIRNTDPSWLRCPAFDAFPLNARRNILHDPESQSNAARRYLGCREKQNRDRPAWRAAISRLYRDGAMGTNRFRSEVPGVPGSCQATQSKSARVFSSRRGWQDGGIREESRGAKKERQEERRQKGRKARKKGEKERRRSSIYHPAKWARWTGLETSRLSFFEAALLLRSGITCSFWR